MDAFAESDLFLSNHGKGPLMARIESVRGDRIEMVRWDTRSPRPRPVRFVLDARFLASKRSCGWKAITACPTPPAEGSK